MSRGSVDRLISLLTRRSLIVAVRKYHGLGNRVRAVLGSEVLARLEGREFAYTWPTGTHFGASFEELWEYDRKKVSTLMSRSLTWRAPYKDHTLQWLDDASRDEPLWQVRTPHALLLPPSSPWEVELRALRPVADVRARVAGIFDPEFSQRPFIGVMVRTHANSHGETREHSPIEWYLQRMHEIRAFWPEVGFFVSADTTTAFDRLLLDFPDSVSQPDKGAYNSKKALIASVVDLYLLASSSHILAPHYSSFPELAAHLAGPGLGLETSQNTVKLTSFEGVTRVDDPLQPSVRREL